MHIANWPCRRHCRLPLGGTTTALPSQSTLLYIRHQAINTCSYLCGLQSS